MLSRWTRALGLALSIWLLAQSPASAESIKILVQSSPLAGSQYYSANRVWGEIRIGDRLSLAREQDNRHDRNAVRVEWNGQKLGYVPRAENRAVAQALDAGERLEARVAGLRDDPDPWRRIEFEIFLVL
ncbi:MAG: HIRAN domain-containing protein [Propionivibrio sp.]|nr:HIRAN domain-containing protein [Propionivibrio sp.]MBP6712024.1 HIRAN domain-containing protein [Propionivibrio sp.]MBP8162590.1 HIRAN domain-containing protein [Propionivibrio sp.]